MNREELKVQALLDTIKSLNNTVADLRVSLTVVTAENQELNEKLEGYRVQPKVQTEEAVPETD